MTYPNGSSAYADLLPTEQEMADLEQVIGEVLGEELGELPDGDYGPWRDDLSQIGAAVDMSVAAEHQRVIENAEPLPRRSEDRTEWLLSRATRGTLTPPTMYRAPLDLSQSSACDAHRDEFGRCGARFHQATCMETVRGEAATGTAQAVQAWNQVLMSNPSSADVTLARADLQRWEDLLDPGTGPADTETLSYMRRQLGIGGKTLPPRPAPSSAAQLGIF
jgi:hypothetical protein